MHALPRSDALTGDTILAVDGLRTSFAARGGDIRSVDGVDLLLRRGETLAIVGESGSGKSVTCLSLMRLVEPPGRVAAGRALLRRRDGTMLDLLAAPEALMRQVRGDDLAMIFQEPATSLNPLYTAGEQIAEVLRHHRGLGRRAAWDAAVALLDAVRIADPRRRAGQYPFEMSGGMRQRVMIAVALACRPVLLIADEPTTALDVTIQAQVLDILRDLSRGDAAGMSTAGMGVLFVTHDMGVVAEIADSVAVMYAGLVVEQGPVRAVLRRPRHPYTRGLLASRIARGGVRRAPLGAIPGSVPDPANRPSGCPFAPRCEWVEDACRAALPALEAVDSGHRSRCRRWREL